MIQIDSIHIEKFRGIRKIDLVFNRKNFGVYGPNGTGKSGIVDAIEFGLTGSVTRLSGRGSGGLSVKSHGPHVDFRSAPAQAMVRINAFSPTLKKSFSIERRVSTPKAPVVTPSGDSDIADLVATLAEHPEFALSRREILKYIIIEPGQRSVEVQALLRLDPIETLRKSLKRAENDSAKSVDSSNQTVAEARTQLQSALKISQLTPNLVLKSVNERRKVLGLGPLTELTKDTSLKAGVLGAAAGPGKPTPRVGKATATADLTKLGEELGRNDTEEEATSRAKAAATLTEIAANPDLLKNLRRRDFLARGLELIDEEMCPLCDHEWDVQALRELVAKKIAAAEQASALKQQLSRDSAVFRQAVSACKGALAAVRQHAQALGFLNVATAISGYEEILANFQAAITEGAAIAATVERLKDDQWRQMLGGVSDELKPLTDAVAALPDPSLEDEAKEFLIRVEERLDVYRYAQRSLQLWKSRAETAKTSAALFEEVSKEALNELYNEVQADFTRYYATIHHDDESKFLGKLTPSAAKLTFEVDFHGRGLFPPGAYHSEGHQDSMGLCLYLALMKKILDDEFRLAVLDDVLMSVDTGHRIDVCRLLKAEFGNTQFIFTTHDQVWLNLMISEGVVEKKAVREFRRWSVDDGPHDWDVSDVWAEIREDLDRNNVPAAAAVLRRYLERASGMLAARLRAKVEFRRDGVQDPGELFDAASARYSKVLESARTAARSWDRKDIVGRVQGMIDEFKLRMSASRADQWMINPSIHYNEWNNLTSKEFDVVAASFRALFECFECPTCGTMLYVEPLRSATDTLRCDCGGVLFNLKAKLKGEGKSQSRLQIDASAGVTDAADTANHPKPS